MNERFRKLFEPLSVGSVRIKNRIAMAPLVIMGMTHANGSPTQRAVDFYAERARGGVGLIIVGGFKVEKEIDTAVEGFPVVTRAVLTPLGELCETVHSWGTKVFIQLTAGLGRVAAPYFFQGKPVSASPIPYYWDPKITCRPLEMEEVGRIVSAFGDAAAIVAAAGADGIEIHGHEGYLLDQFSTSLWNQRTDRYGGDLRGRLTFSFEILRDIKRKVGNHFPVIYRFGLKHFIKAWNAGGLKGETYRELGRDVEEGIEMAKLLQEGGADALHVDAGCYDSTYWAHPPLYQEHGYIADLAAETKRVVKIPVIAVGRLEVPEFALKAVEEGKADMVALGRGLLADPHWPNKIREGREKDIRPCLGCNDGCSGRLHAGKPMSCAVNPSCGREGLYSIVPTHPPKKVWIAGGGPAGMEAARVSAIRGHQVTLYEKERILGGQLTAASVPDFKKDIKRLMEWYQHQIDLLGVDIELGTELTADLIVRGKPDVVFVATGSKPIVPDLPGVDRDNVMTCAEFLLGKKRAGETVVIIGGGLMGCETALWCARLGKKVTVLEEAPQLMASGIPVPRMNKIMLQDLLAAHHVDLLTNVRVEEITIDGVTIADIESNQKTIRADTVALAIGSKEVEGLYETLKDRVVQLYRLGDCKEPGNIMRAIWDASEVARTV